MHGETAFIEHVRCTKLGGHVPVSEHSLALPRLLEADVRREEGPHSGAEAEVPTGLTRDRELRTQWKIHRTTS